MADNTQPAQIIEKEGAGDAMHEEHKEGINDGLKEGVKVETVQGSVALDRARRTDPPNPWSAQMRKLYLFMTVAYLCSALNGTRQRHLIANENPITNWLRIRWLAHGCPASH